MQETDLLLRHLEAEVLEKNSHWALFNCHWLIRWRVISHEIAKLFFHADDDDFRSPY